MFAKTVVCILMFVKLGESSCDYNVNRQSLTCENVQFDEIVAKYEKDKENIKIANLSNCVKKKFNFDKLFPNLNILKLSCAIEELYHHSFTNAPNLVDLDLSHNSLSNIPNGTFKSNLKKLNLSNNKLRNPALLTINNLSDLKQLRLTGNRITNIDVAAFEGSNSLEEIYLDFNGMVAVNSGGLNKLGRLKILDLSNNYIMRLDGDSLQGNGDLTKLSLNVNLLETLPKSLLDKNINLVEFDASNCQLSKIDESLFGKTARLKKINLSNNPIRVFPPSLFKSLAELEELNVSNVELLNIPTGSFNFNAKLKRLDLSRNKLSSMEEPIFFNTTALEFLNISRNALKDLPIKIFQWTSLKTIDLSYNQFETIKPDLLNKEELERVYARGNHIYHLDSTTFATVGNPLKHLDIRDNRMVFIDEIFFEWVANLEVMEITGNPWDCKCFDDLLKYLNDRFIEYTRADYFEGKKGLCVALNPFDCTVDEKNIKKYYEEYTRILQRYG